MDGTGAGLTPVSQLGEFGLIDHLTKKFSFSHPDVVKGIGDDAAVIQAGNTAQIISTDMLVEGIHFDLAYAPLRHLGYKAVTVNLSDIVAMNAIPYGITVSIGMSSRFSVEALEEIYAGIQLACDQYQVQLLGGDMTSSKSGLILSVTAMGKTTLEKVVYRTGAQPNDLICVSGELGSAYAGLLVLDREKAVYLKTPDVQPDLSDYDHVVGRQLRPEARVDVIEALRSRNLQPTSMIDISDGLASEIHHICRNSKVGADLYANKIPIDYQAVKVAEEFSIGPATFALNGGEDYELLFTLPLSDFQYIKDLSGISVIGKVTADPGIVQLMLETGEALDIPATGYEHFGSDSSTQS